MVKKITKQIKDRNKIKQHKTKSEQKQTSNSCTKNISKSENNNTNSNNITTVLIIGKMVIRTTKAVTKITAIVTMMAHKSDSTEKKETLT